MPADSTAAAAESTTVAKQQRRSRIYASWLYQQPAAPSAAANQRDLEQLFPERLSSAHPDADYRSDHSATIKVKTFSIVLDGFDSR